MSHFGTAAALSRIAVFMAAVTLPILRGSDLPDWKIDQVDQAGTAKSTTIRVDPLDNLHIAYIADDGRNFPVRYAFWDKEINKWFVMPVGEMAASCSMTLDSKNRPHIAYVDYGTGSGCGLHYVNWDGSKWHNQRIPLNSDIIAYFTSIALDREDHPSISFYEYRGPKDSEIRIRLRNVMMADKHWQVRTIDPQEGSGKFNCTAADPKGNIHVAYANVATGTAGLRYATWARGKWEREFVETAEGNNGEAVGFSTCLAVDSKGNPHIAYSNQSRPSIRYAFRKGNRWQIQVVDFLLGLGYPDRNSIAVDEQDNPYIAYHDAGRGELKLAYPAGKGWATEVVDSGGSGFTSSVAVSKGMLYIAYGETNRAALNVARRATGVRSTGDKASDSPR